MHLAGDMFALDADRDRRSWVVGVCTMRQDDLEPRLNAVHAHLEAHLTRGLRERYNHPVIVVLVGRPPGFSESVEEGRPHSNVLWGKYEGEAFAWEEGTLYEVKFFELVGELSLPGLHGVGKAGTGHRAGEYESRGTSIICSFSLLDSVV